jgi:SAM-dependent methyltransferase
MWTEGYVSDIDYTHGYYAELSPHRLCLATLFQGVEARPPGGGRYLELGFGQGLSLNIHAAANPGRFWGTDFNPVHAANAQDLAAASGAELTALEDSFEALAARADLPAFDIIALHGIWSWISDANRRVIVDLAGKALKPGGLLYISYNVTPGWSPAMPLRHLLAQHVERAGSGPITDRIDGALAFAQQVVDAGAGYFKANPAVVERLKKLKDQNRNYLAHEYFNADWHPMPFSAAAALLAEAKLTFAASAHTLDQVEPINLGEDARKLLAGIPDPVLRETVRDYVVNAQFRRDVFVKGRRPLPGPEQARRLQAQAFTLLVPPEDRPKKAKGALGEADLQDAIYAPMVEALAADGGAPKTLGRLQAMCPDLGLGKLAQAAQVLVGTGTIAPAHDDATAEAVRPACRALNAELCRRAELSAEGSALASPVTGSGLPVNRFEQVFLRAAALKDADPPAYLWRRLKAQGQVIQKDGQPLQGDDANLAELRTRYEAFKTKRLPILERLGLSPGVG